MDGFVATFFNIDIALEILPALGRGLLNTIYLALIVFPCAFVAGLGLSIMGMSRSWIVRAMSVIYIDFFRSFPPVVLLIVIFYGLPFFGWRIDPLLAASLALILNAASYYAEVQRTGIESVDRGQWEAAHSTGLNSSETYLWVVLPQALRNVVSPLIGNTIELVKLTAIASVVSYSELLKVAKEMQSLLFSPTPLVAAALIYFLMLWPFVRWLSRFERGFMERD